MSQPLFNPTGGYASYVVPAAFILILQQTLFLGAATVGGVAYEQRGSEGRRRRAGARAILGQAFAHLLPVDARDRSLSDHPAAHLWLLDTWTAPRPLLDGRSFRSFSELSRPVRQRLVQAARDGGDPVHRCESAAVFPGRRLLAGRGDSRCDSIGEPHLSEHIGDRRARPHQPDGRKSARRLARLDERSGS